MRTSRILTAARTAVLVGLLALGGCAVPRLLAETTPTHGARIVRNLAYADGPRHGLDIYEPPHGAEPLPVVVFIYGGTWERGAKKIYAFVGRALASKGYVVAIPDYRVYPQARYPDFLQDNALAVRWVRDHAAEYGGDPRRIFLMGHSAGAYDAVMLDVDRRWLGAVGMDPRTDIRGAVGLAGPYDFLPITDREVKIIFGPESGWPDTQPANHVDGREPPMLLVAGTADRTVDPGNATRLAARVREKGGEVTVKLYSGLSHLFTVGVFAGPLRFIAPALADSVAFMRAHDDPAAAAAAKP